MEKVTFRRESDQWGERLNLVWELNSIIEVTAEWVDFDRFVGNFEVAGKVYGQYNLAQVAFILEFFRLNPHFDGDIEEKMREVGLL